MNNTNYYDQERRDILRLIPGNAVRILECGSGFGRLGKLLRETRFCEITGIELNPLSIHYIDGVYDDFFVANLETLKLPFPSAYFDCILYPDVLEHLRDPWAVLDYHMNFLKPGGSVVISIPNVRNLSVLYNLLVRGHWTYEESGILDRTHLRFFTLKEITKELTSRNLELKELKFNQDDYKGIKAMISFLSKLVIPEIVMCQILVRAQKRISN